MDNCPLPSFFTSTFSSISRQPVKQNTRDKGSINFRIFICLQNLESKLIFYSTLTLYRAVKICECPGGSRRRPILLLKLSGAALRFSTAMLFREGGVYNWR